MAKLIFTDHAHERMYLRGISKSLVQSAVAHYHDTKLEDDGDTQFIKSVKRQQLNRNLHVIAKPISEQGKDAWLIKTVWIRGEHDPHPVLKAIRMFVYRLFYRKKS